MRRLAQCGHKVGDSPLHHLGPSFWFPKALIVTSDMEGKRASPHGHTAPIRSYAETGVQGPWGAAVPGPWVEEAATRRGMGETEVTVRA